MEVDLLLFRLKNYYRQLTPLNLYFNIENRHDLINITVLLTEYTLTDQQLFYELKMKLNQHSSEFTKYLSDIFQEAINYLTDYRIKNINISFNLNENQIHHYFTFHLLSVDRQRIEIYKNLEKEQMLSNRPRDFKIIEWLYNKTMEILSQTSTFFLAVTYYDIVKEYLYNHKTSKLDLTNPINDIKSFDDKQLAAVCLLIATKMEEVTSYTIDDIYKDDNLIPLEKQVYDILNQKLILPTTHIFYVLFKLKTLSNMEVNYIRFIILATLYHPNINQLNPSLIAIGSVYLGVIMVREKHVWDDEYKYISGYNKYQIIGAAHLLLEMLKEIADSNYVQKLIKSFRIEKLCNIEYPMTEIPKRLSLKYKNSEIINFKDIEVDEMLGSGTYGVVYIANYRGKQYAVKIAYCSDDLSGLNIGMMREIAILKFTRHPNIISLIYTIYNEHETDNIDPNCYGFIMELMISNLYNIIKKQDNKKFPIIQVKKWAFQILDAVNYLHLRGIMHRDLKTENILIDKNGSLKIGDFGLGRSMVSFRGKYTQPVVTLWYRAPELIIGHKYYSFEIDMWSCGCIIGELIKLAPIFKGLDEAYMIKYITKLLGSEKMLELPGVNKYITKEVPAQSLQTYFEIYDSEFIKLITGLLEPNPKKRYDSKEALASPWLIKQN